MALFILYFYAFTINTFSFNTEIQQMRGAISSNESFLFGNDSFNEQLHCLSQSLVDFSA